MKAKDLRERTPEELRDLEKSLAKDMFQARFKNFTNRLDDTSSIRKNKKDLARVKTLLRQQELVAQAKATPAPAAAAPKAKAKPVTAPKSKSKKPSKKSEAK